MAKKVKVSVFSPSPKDLKLKKSSSSVCRYFLWVSLISLGFVVTVCLLDYQQAQMENHSSFLPNEVQSATKYVMDYAKYDLPERIAFFADDAKSQIVWVTRNVYFGNRSLSQLIYGDDLVEADLVPQDIKEDFELEDMVDNMLNSINEKESTLSDDEDFHIVPEENFDQIPKSKTVGKDVQSVVDGGNVGKLVEETVTNSDASNIKNGDLMQEVKMNIEKNIVDELESKKQATLKAIEEGKEKFKSVVSESDGLNDDAAGMKEKLAIAAQELKDNIARQAAIDAETVLERQRQEVLELAENLRNKINS